MGRAASCDYGLGTYDFLGDILACQVAGGPLTSNFKESRVPGASLSVSNLPSTASAGRLRLWPGVLLVAALWGFFELLPRLELDNRLFLALFQWGAMGIIGAFAVWWLFLSRIPPAVDRRFQPIGRGGDTDTQNTGDLPVA